MSLKKQAREHIAATAARMLSGSVSYLEGAREIFKLSFDAALERDENIKPFAAVYSETDALPIEPKVRALWSATALENLRPEIEAAELWARSVLLHHCARLVERFGSTPGS